MILEDGLSLYLTALWVNNPRQNWASYFSSQWVTLWKYPVNVVFTCLNYSSFHINNSWVVGSFVHWSKVVAGLQTRSKHSDGELGMWKTNQHIGDPVLRPCWSPPLPGRQLGPKCFMKQCCGKGTSMAPDNGEPTSSKGSVPSEEARSRGVGGSQGGIRAGERVGNENLSPSRSCPGKAWVE